VIPVILGSITGSSLHFPTMLSLNVVAADSDIKVCLSSFVFKNIGIVSIVLLILAIIVCFISLIMFFYIVYKLWHGNFGRRQYRTTRLEDQEFSFM
jgi:hypothetical protein